MILFFIDIFFRKSLASYWVEASCSSGFAWLAVDAFLAGLWNLGGAAFPKAFAVLGCCSPSSCRSAAALEFTPLAFSNCFLFHLGRLEAAPSRDLDNLGALACVLSFSAGGASAAVMLGLMTNRKKYVENNRIPSIMLPGAGKNRSNSSFRVFEYTRGRQRSHATQLFFKSKYLNTRADVREVMYVQSNLR